MTSAMNQDWSQANQRFLTAALALVKAALQRYVTQADDPAGETNFNQLQAALHQAAEAMPAPAALTTLGEIFALSPFERELLLLCAGMELDSSFAPLCAAAHSEGRQSYPTFSLALAALGDSHWSALTPDASLRYWRLIELSQEQNLTTSRLQIDERILHYLTGLHYLDERLVGLAEPVQIEGTLAPSQERLVEQVAATWQQAPGGLPVIELWGRDPASQQLIATAAAQAVGLSLYQLSLFAIPQTPAERSAFIRLWEREALLSHRALLLDLTETEPDEANRAGQLNQLLRSLNGPLLLMSRGPTRSEQRAVVSFKVGNPTRQEQSQLWQQALSQDSLNLNGNVEALVAQFDLNAAAIKAASARASATGEASLEMEAQLWQACRSQARPQLGSLAQPLEAVAGWNDLVLPEPQKRILQEIVTHVRRRHTVYEGWGFAAKSKRGLGISALFAGASGTGKTMAAEVLANTLRLDLYRIDLSAVVSKYIGETEKNLRRIFDAAESGSVILLFDEADALFGKRSEVKDSHDRYANIEISYLLQKMEAYLGLAILTSNMKEALDDAFLRRIRFLVRFPFPGPEQRRNIWQSVLPDKVPRQELDFGQLAQLNIAGGNIRNIAMHAAFLAAEAGQPLTMGHIRRAAETEYAKLEKTLTAGETRGWTI
jgi:hypothetical protein